MGAFSIWHWIIVLIVVLILFGGKGQLSGLMGDFGKGLRNFKDQMKSKKDEDDDIEVVENKASSKKKSGKKAKTRTKKKV